MKPYTDDEVQELAKEIREYVGDLASLNVNEDIRLSYVRNEAGKMLREQDRIVPETTLTPAVEWATIKAFEVLDESGSSEPVVHQDLFTWDDGSQVLVTEWSNGEITAAKRESQGDVWGIPATGVAG